MFTIQEIIKELELEGGFLKEIGGQECYIFNFDGDKLIVSFKTYNLENVLLVSSILPEIQHDIAERIKNEKNKESPPEVEGLALSMYLWDLYVVCFYPNEVDESNRLKINAIERNKTIARKIIINYTNKENLQRDYIEKIFPEIYLDSIFEKNIEIEGFIEDIDLEEIQKEIRYAKDLLKFKYKE